MSYLTYTKKANTVKEYIEKKWAVTPDALGNKLHISRRSVFRIINYLRESGVDIRYSSKTKSYKIISG